MFFFLIYSFIFFCPRAATLRSPVGVVVADCVIMLLFPLFLLAYVRHMLSPPSSVLGWENPTPGSNTHHPVCRAIMCSTTPIRPWILDCSWTACGCILVSRCTILSAVIVVITFCACARVPMCVCVLIRFGQIAAVIVSIYEEPVQPQQAASIVEKLGDYLITCGY